jgi:hypothetical protein
VRYITNQGAEASLGSDAECTAAIRTGLLTARSRVYEESSGRWVRASEHGYLSVLFPVAARIAAALRWVAVIAWAVGLLNPPIIALLQGRDVPVAAGLAAISGLVLGLVGLWIRRFFTTSRSRTVLALVLGVLFCSWEFPMLRLQSEAERLHLTTQHLRSALAAATSAGGATSQASASSHTAAPAPRGGYDGNSSLLDAISDLIQDNNRLVEQYKSAYAALHAETLLLPETLVNGAQLRAASARLDDWNTYLDSYEAEDRQVRARFESKLASLVVPDSTRAAFIQSYSEGKERAEPDRQRFLEIERSMNGEIRDLYAFMGKRAKAVKLRDGKLVFPRSADVEVYNDHLQKIRALGAEESTIQGELLRMRNDGMAKLQELARSAAAQ